MRFLLAAASVAASLGAGPDTSYWIDDTRGPGRTFDGIGGLSGGGATSVFIRDYPEPHRSTIMDLLFKPNFGASLHILKVEIGADAQSTDGGESSHMHDPWTTNYNTGYEWFLIQQAKARNPNIKLYGLPWAFPQWVSCNPGTLTNCTNNPYDRADQTAGYITSWVQGLKTVYGYDADYIGSWNERGYDINYIETLRATLNTAGFTSTKIMVADSSFSVANDINKNPAFAAAVWGLGAHYPNMQSGSAAEATGKQLWASEEDSTYNNAVGAGCWARVINQNYVRGNMSASINWNLLSAYMKGTNWWRAGLMTSFQPWAGSFGSLAMIWATAHTTQFATPGAFAYLLNGTGPGTGSGLLQAGGSYVTLENFATGDFSIVIEKMSRDHSPCCRPGLPAYFAGPETATFTLAGAPAKAASLNVWRTHWAFGAPGDVTSEFINMGTVPVVGGKVTLAIDVDSLYTLTTLTTGKKGGFTPSPPQAVFPSAYLNDFNACSPGAEAPYFSDQNGAFECVASADPGHGIVMRQQTPLKPIAWGGDIRPHSLLGSRDLTDVSLSIDVKLTDGNGSAILGARLAGTTNSVGVVWAIDATGTWNVTNSMQSVQGGTAFAKGRVAGGFAPGIWHRVRLDVNGSALSVWVDGVAQPAGQVPWAGATGHCAIGTVQYAHYTEFDNVQLLSQQTVCDTAPAVGTPLAAVSCASEVGPRAGGQLEFTPVNASTCPYGSPCAGAAGAFALASNAGLCLSAKGPASDNAWPLVLAPCAALGDDAQTFTQQYTMLYQSKITHSSTGRTLCATTPDIGSPAVLAKNTAGLSCGNFVFVGDEREIVSINDLSVCIGTC